jgi:hypothetical protein
VRAEAEPATGGIAGRPRWHERPPAAGQRLANSPDGKMAIAKEMSMANADMSKGDMRSACKHYMKAQMGAK